MTEIGKIAKLMLDYWFEHTSVEEQERIFADIKKRIPDNVKDPFEEEKPKQESELDKLIHNFTSHVVKEVEDYLHETVGYAPYLSDRLNMCKTQVNKNIKDLAKRKVDSVWAGQIIPVESVDRYVDLFAKAKQQLEGM